MFDVSPTEFFTIALIALIVFGPQRLPEIARKLGGYVSEIRKAANDLRAGLDEEVRQIQTPLQELKQDLTKPVSEIKSTIDETSKAISEPIEQAAAAADTSDDATSAVTPNDGPASVEAAPEESVATADPAPEDDGNGHRVEWIAPEPQTGVKPDDAWDGLDDEIPEAIETDQTPAVADPGTADVVAEVEDDTDELSA